MSIGTKPSASSRSTSAPPRGRRTNANVSRYHVLGLPAPARVTGPARGLEGNDAQLSEDELHFIVVHQVFELWFKLMLRELRLARDKMVAPWVEEETIPYVVHHLRRVNEIFRLAVEQFRVMETLTPQDFLAFRSKLGTASGFQSFQMREIEAIMGLAPDQRAAQGHTDPLQSLQAAVKQAQAGAPLLARVLQARQDTSLRQALHAWLFRTPIQGSRPTDPDDASVVENFLQAYLAALDQHQSAQMAPLLADPRQALAVRAQFAAMLDSAQAFLHATDVPDEQSDRRCSAYVPAFCSLNRTATFPCSPGPGCSLILSWRWKSCSSCGARDTRAWSSASLADG